MNNKNGQFQGVASNAW